MNDIEAFNMQYNILLTSAKDNGVDIKDYNILKFIANAAEVNTQLYAENCKLYKLVHRHED